MVYGPGMVTCAGWRQHRSTRNKAATLQLQAWIDGFLSGYNTASEGTDFLAPQPMKDASYTWIDNHCSQHPIDLVEDAAAVLKNKWAARARR